MNITTNDGRTLVVHDSTQGRPAAHTIVWHHGSPQTGAALQPHLEKAAERGIRWVSYGRPSYGGSTDQPDRTVDDAADDVRTIAEALDIDRLAVMGASGGGPHALACAARLPDLVWGTVTIAGLAPYTTDFDWFGRMAGDGPSLRAAQDGRRAREVFEETAEFDETSFNDLDYAALKGRWASLNADVGVASAAGTAGLVTDDLALVAPWGEGLARLATPVLLVHGGDDRVVPPAHSHHLLDILPDAELWLRPRDGHISILDAGELAIEWLLQRAA